MRGVVHLDMTVSNFENGAKSINYRDIVDLRTEDTSEALSIGLGA